MLSCPLFFFSSRRRHTRCLSDWSSDVCSSDLHGRRRANREDQRGKDDQHLCRIFVARSKYSRSEERRVGKECRSRWAAYQSNNEKDEHTRLQCRCSSEGNRAVTACTAPARSWN